jgi:hypothetical protein
MLEIETRDRRHDPIFVNNRKPIPEYHRSNTN